MSDADRAREALHETRRATERTDAIAAEATDLFAKIRAHRERNHYAEKLRLIMRGAH